ncbi:DUF5133 domain-containing protein [Streptomyces sp. NPDC006529]|uniref:DUF5133 domain-containing protein n=1 Tax=Streptomyces sp. NPDC006529 TaxID=3157177 RepID=UPI0033B8C3B0
MNDKGVPESGGRDRAEVVAERALVGQATGMLMAVVPCSTDTARRLLAVSAQAAGASLVDAAHAALRLCTGDGPLYDPVADALADAIDRLLEADPPEDPVGCASSVQGLGEYVNHYLAARRRALAAPGDATARSFLDDAGYALCVLTGHPATHTALPAAERLSKAGRRATLAAPNFSAPQPRARMTAARGTPRR